MNLRNIAVVLSANTGQFRSQMAMAAQDVNHFEKEVEKSGGTVSRWSSLLHAAPKVAALAFAAALVIATAAAIGFESRMRNVNSISHLSEQAFRQQGQQVLDLSKTFPQTANVLAEGLYDIASSGFQGADGMKVLTASAMAASAGMSDTATSAKAITAVLNAYGLSADQATRVGNVLFQGVNVGVMSFEELASSIGNSVGTAAAASVSIEDLTAGIATMTLSGISAAEASTAMNRTLQGLIDPSDDLANAIHALGYESGASMLKTIGLHATMEKLRNITGGNIETLLRYFPEVRAARGALALMSAEGENYNKVQRAMNDAQRDGGAMQKTFREQMKSTSAQLTIIKNNVTAFAIEVGTNMLPYVQDGIKELKNFTNSATDLAREGRSRLQPFLENLRPIFEDLQKVMGMVADITLPIAAGFAAIVAIGIIQMLNTLSTAVKATTGFLADHKEIVGALVAFYGVRLIASLYIASGGFDALAISAYNATGAMAASGVVQTLKTIAATAYVVSAAFATQGIAGAAGAAKTAIVGLVSPTMALSVAAAALAASFIIIQQTNEKLAAAGRGEVEKWNAGLDSQTATLGEMTKHWNNARISIMGVDEELDTMYDKRGNLQSLSDVFFDEQADLKAMREELVKVQDEYGGYLTVIQEVARELNVSEEEALKMVREQKIAAKDVSDARKDAEEKQQEAIKKTVDAEREKRNATEDTLHMMGATQDEFKRLAGLTGEEFEAEAARVGELAKKAQEFSEKVGKAWSSQMDVISALGTNVDATGKDILKWYDTMIGDGEKFSENIRKAIEMGYDPQLISRMLEAGPKQAGPLLEEMVKNQGQHFIDSVNQSEQALEKLNQKAIELARLTNRAMNAESDVMAADLRQAMAISTIIMANGGQTTMKALTDQLHIGADEVKRIANEYGISLAAALNPVRLATGQAQIRTDGVHFGNSRVTANAEGGYIDPRVWGNTNQDSVLSWVMPGEVVIKKKSVESIGVDRLLYANETGQLPGYARGGVVGLPAPPNFPGGTMGDTAEGAANQTYMKAVAFQAAQQALAYASSGPSGAALGGAVADWVREAMRITGVPESWFGPLMSRVRLESGGNPRAINLWDSNAKKGIPSKGLFQTIDPTFNHYALPGMHDIWNPVHNGVAAIRYMIARYGSIFNINPRTGYGEGGVVHETPWDSGGTAAPGWNLINNTTGGPEVLRPWTGGDGMPQIHLTANVVVYVGDTQLREVIRQEITVDQDKRDRRTRSGSRA